MSLKLSAYLSPIEMNLKADGPFLDAQLLANHGDDNIRTQEFPLTVQVHVQTLHHVAEAHPQ